MPSSKGSRSAALVRLFANAGTGLARSGLLSTGTIAQLEQTLLSAGLRGGNGLGVFVGAKVLLVALPAPAGLAGAAPFRTCHRCGAASAWPGPPIAGLFLPDYVVRSRRKAFLAQGRRAGCRTRWT